MIRTAQVIPASDVGRYAWAHLRRFHNVAYVASVIAEEHRTTAKQKDNVRKQAEQVRYCLQQAEEYFEASRIVSLTTRPTLLYYCAMSLALAELLMKQSGDSSLDKAREQHRHHGLTANIQAPRRGATELTIVAGSMRAVPMIADDGTRRGTFELWHRSAREQPMAGMLHHHPIRSFRLLLGSEDKRMPVLPPDGITLLDCFKSLPGLSETLGMNQITSDIVRARITVHQAGNNVDYDVRFHPGPRDVWAECLERISIRAIYHEQTQIDIQDTYGTVIINSDKNYPVEFHLPSGVTLGPQDVRFWSKPVGLNEFGFMYVGLFVLSNYARYFPDKWVKDVERATPIAHLTEQLLELAAARGPLVTLNEMSRCLYVPGDPNA
jgi:hypothetical protein